VVVGLLVAVIGAWLLLVVALCVMRPRDVRVVELVRLVPDVLRLVRNLLTDRTVPRAVPRYVRRRLGDDELRLRWPGTPEGYELLSGILR